MSLSHQQKVYVPKDSRTNQYISAEIKVTDALLAHYASHHDCYHTISQHFFEQAEMHALHNVHFIANDKLPVVRFYNEAYCLQTAEQIVFFYNPAYHEAQNVFVANETHTAPHARKLRLVFLATGIDIRSQSADFHARVVKCLAALMPLLPESGLKVKVRDHQHLSYDLFANAKGNKETYGYKLRGISHRYQARQCPLPTEHHSLSYVTVTLALSRKLKQTLSSNAVHPVSPNVNNDSIHHQDYTHLYQQLEDKFFTAMAAKQLNRVAMVANTLTPLVRNSKYDQLENTQEIQMIGFDPNSLAQQTISHWDGKLLAGSAHFVIAAGHEHYEDSGFGRFLNQVEDALKGFASTLALDKSKDDLIVRFHQHISYQNPPSANNA